MYHQSFSKSSFVEFRKDNIFQQYEFDPKELGRGAYGIVYKARRKQSNGPYLAIKRIMKRSIRNPQYLANQIENLSRLDHPSILKIYQIFQDQSSIYLVTDLCEGGELFSKLQSMGSFSQRDAKIIFTQLLEAIYYCHKQKTAHRDIKPQNILFLDQKSLAIKLIDFGLSYRYQNNMRQQLIQKNDNKLVGTAYYIAPQVIEGGYDQRCDIWSAGVILYVLVSACPPFDGQTDHEIMDNVRKRNYNFAIPQMNRVSSQCKDLISKILVPQIMRLSIQQIFEHPWMKSQVSNLHLQLNFKKMSDYTKYSKLKKITAVFIASKFTQHQVSKLRTLFQQMDLNHDGSISIQQLKAALQSQKQQKNYQELKVIVDAIDTDKNGTINYTQFLASSVESAKIFTREHLARFFRMVDKDGNGKVDRNQLKQLLQQNGNNVINGKDIDQIMNQYDLNKDGTIDFNQFVNGMTK